MSTINVTNLKHASSGSNNIVLDSSGNIAVQAGTVSAPAIQATGDSNTGIYFPAADNIGFTTGGTIRGRWTTDGLCFNADTSAANALDDYEEGTWTPVVKGEGTAGTVTYGARNARYTKVGRAVTVEAYIDWNSGAGGAGALLIDGLPFAANGAVVYPSLYIGEINNIALSANCYAMCRIGNGQTIIYIQNYPVGGGTRSGVQWDAAGYIMIGGTYSV